MAAQPAKTVTVAALAGAAFAVAYKATTKYLSNDEDETPKSLDDSTKLDESTASSFYGIRRLPLATRHEARSMDREKSERSLRLDGRVQGIRTSVDHGLRGRHFRLQSQISGGHGRSTCSR